MSEEQSKAVVKKDVSQQPVPVIIQISAQKGFIAAGGTQEQFNREAGFAMQAIQNNPYLAQMDKQSILNAVVNVALTNLTLNPELKLGYLIPRKGKLYFMASYMGKKEIMLRSGMVRDVWVNLVYKNDEFTVIEGGDRKLIHKPNYFAKDRGDIMGGYWQAVLHNGEKPFGVMPLDRIMEIKQRSEAVKSGKGSPWDTDEEEMMKKTLLNWGFKSLPKTGISDDVLKAMEAEAAYEREDHDEWVKKQEYEKKHPFDDDAPDDGTITDAIVMEETPQAQQETETKNAEQPPVPPKVTKKQ